MNRETYVTLEDDELISRIKNGELEVFGVLFERYLNLIYKYVRCRVSEDQEAEDLTEIVFLKAYEALDRYQERGWPFSSFLYQIARNQLADYYRAQPKEVSLEEAKDLEAVDLDLEERAIVSEKVQILREGLEKLPEDYQEVIRLRLLLDLTTTEVAASLNRSKGAVRILLHRALAALRKQVGNDE
jgi:RNA polymerase sigma-70 factor (ECF subfamily)